MHVAEKVNGLPPGGATGQVPQKASNEDFDAHWVDPVTESQVTNAVEQGVTAQRFDFIELINSTISI